MSTPPCTIMKAPMGDFLGTVLPRLANTGEFGGSHPPNLYCFLKFCCAQKNCFKHIIKRKIFPPKFFSPNGCGVRKLIECLLKSIDRIQFVKVTQCLFWNHGFFIISYLGAIFLQSLHLLLQAKPHPSPQSKSFEQSKEMTFDHRLTNLTDLVVRGLYCPSVQNLIQKALHEITVNSQSLLNLFSPIVPSSAVLQRHITSPHISALATNIYCISWHASCYFLIFSGTFSISAISWSLVIRWAYQY